MKRVSPIIQCSMFYHTHTHPGSLHRDREERKREVSLLMYIVKVKPDIFLYPKVKSKKSRQLLSRCGLVASRCVAL